MLESLEAEPTLENLFPDPGHVHLREDTPRTKYEKTFLQAGETIYFMDFRKKSR